MGMVLGDVLLGNVLIGMMGGVFVLMEEKLVLVVIPLGLTPFPFTPLSTVSVAFP